MGCVTDKEKEGHFKSINDGKVMSQELSWYGDNPNQGTEANFVQLNKQYKSLLWTHTSENIHNKIDHTFLVSLRKAIT